MPQVGTEGKASEKRGRASQDSRRAPSVKRSAGREGLRTELAPENLAEPPELLLRSSAHRSATGRRADADLSAVAGGV